MIQKIERVTVAGSGNVATHLAKALVEAGIKIEQIYSRNLEHASSLAAVVGATAVNDVARLDSDAQMLLIALPDRVIPEFALDLKEKSSFSGIVAHTCGSQPLSVLDTVFSKAGVFYPLQTFNRFNHPDMAKVPFCIEGSYDEVKDALAGLARLISEDVRFIDSRQRANLHLAAVFACNFTNHMYALSADILENAGVGPDILRPLIMETTQQIGELHPGLMQTGPAVRGDASTMAFHQELLQNHPEVSELYRQISESIVRWEATNRKRK